MKINIRKTAMAVGFLLIAAALVLFIRNIIEETRAAQYSEDNLKTVSQQIYNNLSEYSNTDSRFLSELFYQTDLVTEEGLQQGEAEKQISEKVGSQYNKAAMNPDGEIYYPDYVVNPQMEPPATDVNGLDYIGILSIPSLHLNLPIIGTSNETNLKISPCRYAGTPYVGGFVIAGHNYRSHFSPVKNIPVGSEVLFTDMSGNVFKYAVQGIERLNPNETERMIDPSFDLTLFTCTTDRAARVAVRCKRVETESELEL